MLGSEALPQTPQWGSGVKTVVRGSGAEAAMRGGRVSSSELHLSFISASADNNYLSTVCVKQL